MYLQHFPFAFIAVNMGFAQTEKWGTVEKIP